MSKIVIIGGGPAGCLAAVSAAGNGHEVHIYEKNEKLGKKLFITGKGRCNFTNDADMKTIMENVVSNPKFLFSAFRNFTNDDIINLIEGAGCPAKVERGGRVFPASDHSSDIIKALEKVLKDYGVKIHLNTEIKALLINDGSCSGIKLFNGTEVKADRVIVATGGVSYPTTGSTGDGIRWAKAAGHSIVDTVPALVSLKTKKTGITPGVSLKNIRADLYDGDKLIYSDFGEMLFTHTGVSGPVILSASSFATRLIRKKELTLKIDLKPALDEEKLDDRILRDFEENKNKTFRNSLGKLLISSLVDEVIRQSGIDPDKRVNEISKNDRAGLIKALKGLEFTVTGSEGFKEAIITQGGVSTKEIDPKTMSSKLIKGLGFAGEVIDVDALTGGFNLQIAWSTGYAAGAAE